jgi:hypothetical protein
VSVVVESLYEFGKTDVSLEVEKHFKDDQPVLDPVNTFVLEKAFKLLLFLSMNPVHEASSLLQLICNRDNTGWRACQILSELLQRQGKYKLGLNLWSAREIPSWCSYLKRIVFAGPWAGEILLG